MLSLSAKTKGVGHQMEKKTHGVARGSKNWPSDNFAHIVHSTSRTLNFNQKQKKVMPIENYVIPTNQKS